MNLSQLKELLCSMGFEESVVLENPDYADAAVGVTTDGQVVYDYSKMVNHLGDVDGMNAEDAIEFIDYNTIGAMPYMGELRPVIIHFFDNDIEQHLLGV